MTTISRVLPVLVACTAHALAGPVINEVMFRPGTTFPENTALEFIEIHNPDPSAVDLSGWTFTNGIAYTFPPATSIPAGGYLVVAADPVALASASGFGAALGPWDPDTSLSNSGETITLSRPDGLGGFEKADEIRYADEGDWALATRTTLGGWSWVSAAGSAGSSAERINPELSVNSGQNWASSTAAGGTPGMANSKFATNVAPVIRDVAHSPAVPKSHEVVTISCRLSDETPPAGIAATLFWRDASMPVPGTFQSVAMTNDGNGRFAATLGAKADKTIVEFYIQSTDGSAARTWPAPTSEGQNANCTYQVDNEVVAGNAATYRMVLTAPENAAFETLASTNPQSDRLFHLTFIAGHGEKTTIRYRTHMRIRGQSSRNFIHKPLRISFPGDDPWDGITDFSLNPKFPWVQFLGMRVIQAAGLTAGDAVPVELRRNGIESATGSGTNPDYGMWVRIEAINGDYSNRHFPEAQDVQLYRKNAGTTFWSTNFTAPANPDGSYSGWTKQSQSGRNDWSDVQNFSTVWQSVCAPHFTGATPGDVASGTWNGTGLSDGEVATLSTVTDLNQMARWLAVMTILNNTEHNLSNGYDNDYAGAFVFDGTHRRLQILPHDTDNLLGKGDSPKGSTAVGLFAMTDPANAFKPLLPLLGNATTPGNPAFRELYLTEIRKLYGSLFDADTVGNPYPPFHAWIDNHLGNWVPDAIRTQLKVYATSRQNYLLGLIGAGKIAPPAAESTATFESAPAGSLRFNEILANNLTTFENTGTYPDVIELHNTGGTNIAISGFTIADATNSYTFPGGSGNVPAGGFRVIHANTLGFSLGSKGDTVRLYNEAMELLDEVTFGPQVADRSISRTTGNLWELTPPTIGAANAAPSPLGALTGVRLNEWAGNSRYRLSDDFVELHNPAAQPVALGGLRLTDDLASYPTRHVFPPLSFIGAATLLEIDSDQFGFGLNGQFESIWLTGSNGAILDQADLIAQHADTSSGRSPDGSNTWADFAVPSPGISNGTTPVGFQDLLESLRITEIMYEPLTSGDFEFIELQNIGTTPLSLAGVRFTSGIDYTFGAGVVLAPDDYIVVCKHRPSFLARYPSASAKLAAGFFTGSLSNGGEIITLTLPSPWSLNILRFEYENNWYAATAGGGESLITLDQGVTDPADWGNSEIWGPSEVLHGSPGTGEAPVITSPAAADGIVGDAFSYLVTATRTPTSFGASGLPAGLSIDSVSGLISGTPTASGSFPVTLSATRGSNTATLSLNLQVTLYGELHHFTWHHVPTAAYAGTPFTVRVSGRDIGGRLIADLEGMIPISAGTLSSAHLNLPGGPATLSSQVPSPILITELTDEQEDQFELQNVSGSAFNTAGWTIVLGDSLTNVNTRNATTFALPASMAAGELLRVSDTAGAGRTFFGSGIAWSHNSTNPTRGWVMLFDEASRLRDFVAFGWTSTQLATLSITVGGKTAAPISAGHWSGNGLAVGTRGSAFNTTDSWSRIGTTDSNSSTGWAWTQFATSFGVTNTALALPWEVVYPIPGTPASVYFTGGQFFGDLSVTGIAGSVFLTATGPGGLKSHSSSFPVYSAADADNDGLPDAWELLNGLSPLVPGDALLDSDGDGQSNLDEFEAGTNPQLASSVLALTTGVPDLLGQTCLVEWQAVGGKTYHIRSSTNLGSWTHQGTVFADESGMQALEIPTGGEPRIFFQMTVEP